MPRLRRSPSFHFRLQWKKYTIILLLCFKLILCWIFLDTETTSFQNSTDNDSWPHLKLPFLQPDKIRDGQRRLKSDPNYDPKTLYVPEDFKNSLTPVSWFNFSKLFLSTVGGNINYSFFPQGVRQWWELKSQNFDVVLFFKVGKFYELYHMDAVLAANELNLTFMRVSCGYKYSWWNIETSLFNSKSLLRLVLGM